MPDLQLRLQASVGRKFRVVRELTGGGMARVFLAEDVELEREVAIKVLSPHPGDDTFLERFRSEVLQTTRLQHPTIVSVFEVGAIVDNGPRLPYYIMPYVRGESLRSRLKHEGSLSVSASLRILRSVLDALSHAHGHGVVHRDIKPENIFLSGTNAVLADFGIAKAVSGPRHTAELTSPGTSVGTPAYMAPEQVAGDDRIDARADLYSIGVVAFEMLAGALPWNATNTSEMLAAKVRGSHTSIQAVRGDVPDALASLIDRCLAWDPAKRPPSADEVLHVLERIPITHTPVAPLTPRLVSLRSRWNRTGLAAGGLAIALMAVAIWKGPSASQAAGRAPPRPAIRLALLGPRPEPGIAPDNTLGHQLYHDLVTDLYPVPDLELVNEAGIKRMAELGLTREQVTQKLQSAGFDSVLSLETTLGSDGTYQLQLSLHRLQRPGRPEYIGRPLRLQTLGVLPPDSARTLAGLLAQQVVARFRLTPAMRDVRDTESGDAESARRKGRDASSKRTPGGVRQAIAHHDRAIELDSTYAQAWADLSDALTLALFYRYRTDEEPYAEAARALRVAEHAIALEPSLAEGYTARGYIGMVAGAPVDFVRRSYATAQQRHPENPDTRLWHVGLLAVEKNYAQALDTLAELIALDPTDPAKLISAALYSLPRQHYTDVVERAVQTHAVQPDFPFASAMQLWGLILLGGDRIGECLTVEAGPYLGARATCIERAKGRAAALPVLDTLSQFAMDPPQSDSLFDGSQYASEMALYAAAHREWDSARLWIRTAFQESPLGIERSFLRSGLFGEELVDYGDSLRAEAWKRVLAMAKGSTTGGPGTKR